VSKRRRSSDDSQLSIFGASSSSSLPPAPALNRGSRLALVPPPPGEPLPSSAPTEAWCGHFVRDELDDEAMIAVGWAVRRLTGAELGPVSFGKLLAETGLDAYSLRRALRMLRAIRPNGEHVLEVATSGGLRMRLRVGPARLEHALRSARALQNGRPR